MQIQKKKFNMIYTVEEIRYFDVVKKKRNEVKT